MNIAEILRKCPKGTKLYSPVFGEVELTKVDYDEVYPITCLTKNGDCGFFTRDGILFFDYPDSECMLFPSKDQLDWSKFVVIEQDTNTRPKPQFKPFEKVLVRDGDQYEWQCNFFSGMDKENFYLCVSARWEQCIPYEGNEHLLGTTNKPQVNNGTN